MYIYAPNINSHPVASTIMCAYMRVHCPLTFGLDGGGGMYTIDTPIQPEWQN